MVSLSDEARDTAEQDRAEAKLVTELRRQLAEAKKDRDEYDEARDMLIIRQVPTQLKDQLKRRKD